MIFLAFALPWLVGSFRHIYYGEKSVLIVAGDTILVNKSGHNTPTRIFPHLVHSLCTYNPKYGIRGVRWVWYSQYYRLNVSDRLLL
ncbi:MAG: hypothetical protein UY34_C0003G0007 [Parcubacteria group bacterium GW2011_GWA2_48_9]|nr:MAG: hypothetical protein UY34_C0003G0007 [Parcubacteria group bacterium GW2011_GWA2_48_9]